MQFDRIWVFDQDNSKLILFNSEGKRTLETENLYGMIGLKEPIQMLERFGNLYLVDEGRGVYIFEMFVEEFKDMFVNLDSEEALEIIGKWIENRFGHPVRDVISVDIMST
jgi:hypothetical protein